MEGLAFLGIGGCKSTEEHWGNPETVTVEEATIRRTGEAKEEAGVIRTLTFGGGAQGAGAWNLRGDGISWLLLVYLRGTGGWFRACWSLDHLLLRQH